MQSLSFEPMHPFSLGKFPPRFRAVESGRLGQAGGVEPKLRVVEEIARDLKRLGPSTSHPPLDRLADVNGKVRVVLRRYIVGPPDRVAAPARAWDILTRLIPAPPRDPSYPLSFGSKPPPGLGQAAQLLPREPWRQICLRENPDARLE